MPPANEICTTIQLSRRLVLLGAATILVQSPPVLAGDEPPLVKIRDLWAERGEFSELAKILNGRLVTLRGYMAPPLKPEIDFFVLTKIPMAFCPFCDNEISWPEDLVLVQVKSLSTVTQFNTLIICEGQLEIGTKTDLATGFVSRVRLNDATYRIA